MYKYNTCQFLKLDTEDMYFRLGSYFTQLGKVTGIDSSYSDIKIDPHGMNIVVGYL